MFVADWFGMRCGLFDFGYGLDVSVFVFLMEFRFDAFCQLDNRCCLGAALLMQVLFYCLGVLCFVILGLSGWGVDVL